LGWLVKDSINSQRYYFR